MSTRNRKGESIPEGMQSHRQDYLTACGQVMSILKGGSRAEPVKRKELVERTGLYDRSVRQIIKDLRQQGVRICTATDSGGYWIAGSESDYWAFRSNYVSYAYEILRIVQAMDSGPIVGQEDMGMM